MQQISRILFTERGAALPFALVATALVAISTAALLSYWTQTRAVVERTIDDIEARYFAESQLNILAAKVYHSAEELYAEHTVGDASSFEAAVRIEPFGSWWLGTATVTKGADRWHFASLYGSKPADRGRAITLTDSVGGLTLAGSTTITGAVAIGARPLRTSSLKGRPFTGVPPDLVDHTSNPENVPTFDLDEQLTRAGWAEGAVRISGGMVVDETTELPPVLIVDGAVDIRGPLELPRLQVIVSTGVLRITGDVYGSFSLLAGNNIRVTDAILSADVFGSNTVRIEGSTLLFPSTVYVSDGTRGSTLQILNGTRIEGSVIVRDGKEESDEPVLVIDKKSTVNGRIATNGLTQLDGTVEGSIETGSFHFYAAPTTYRNWLNDATVDASKVTAEFFASPEFEGGLLVQLGMWEVGRQGGSLVSRGQM